MHLSLSEYSTKLYLILQLCIPTTHNIAWLANTFHVVEAHHRELNTCNCRLPSQKSKMLKEDPTFCCACTSGLSPPTQESLTSKLMKARQPPVFKESWGQVCVNNLKARHWHQLLMYSLQIQTYGWGKTVSRHLAGSPRMLYLAAPVLYYHTVCWVNDNMWAKNHINLWCENR